MNKSRWSVLKEPVLLYPSESVYGIYIYIQRLDALEA